MVHKRRCQAKRTHDDIHETENAQNRKYMNQEMHDTGNARYRKYTKQEILETENAWNRKCMKQKIHETENAQNRKQTNWIAVVDLEKYAILFEGYHCLHLKSDPRKRFLCIHFLFWRCNLRLMVLDIMHSQIWNVEGCTRVSPHTILWHCAEHKLHRRKSKGCHLHIARIHSTECKEYN